MFKEDEAGFCSYCFSRSLALTLLFQIGSWYRWTPTNMPGSESIENRILQEQAIFNDHCVNDSSNTLPTAWTTIPRTSTLTKAPCPTTERLNYIWIVDGWHHLCTLISKLLLRSFASTCSMQPILESYLTAWLALTFELPRFRFALAGRAVYSSGLGMTPGSEHVVNIRASSTVTIDMM